MNALEHVAGMLHTAIGFDEISPYEVQEYLRRLIDASLEFGEEVNTEKMQRLSSELGRKFGHLPSEGTLMHIDTLTAITDLLCSKKGADMLEINNILRSYDGVMTREGLFAFCRQQDLWLKIVDTQEEGARYYALDSRHIDALLHRRP